MPIGAETCQGKPLSERQLRAIDALLTHTSKQEAAEAAGIARRTLSKYLSQDDFKAALRAAQDALIADATANLKQASNPAITTLLEVCQDAENPPSVRVSASRAILENALRYSEFSDVLSELRRLEGEYL